MPTISQQVEKISEIFTNLYIDELKKSGKGEQAEILEKIFSFQKEGKPYQEYLRFIARDLLKKDSDEISLADIEKSPLFVDALGEFAKINDALRRVRGIANQEFFNENLRNNTADSFKYTLTQFAEKNIPSDEAQQYLDKVKISTSTTSHPTNPTGVAFTREAMRLAEVVAEFSKDGVDVAYLEKKLRQQAQVVIATPMVEKKKSQAQEVEEGLLYVDAIYDAHSQAYDDFAAVTSEMPAYKNLKLLDNMFDPCVWISGDGDGNPNSTEDSLRNNISEFRRRIKERYREDLNSESLSALSGDILEKLNDVNYTAQNFVRDLEEKRDAETTSSAAKIELENLCRKAKTFGFHYAKIDIRHEAGDIMKATLGLLKQAGIVAADKAELSAEEIKEFFKNDEVITKIKALETSEIEDELTRRIFGRLRAVAENPDMSDKLIIAEFKTPANAAASLFLLKASGNQVGNENAKMNIVPLAEEKATLEKLPEDLTTVLSDEDYLAHVNQTKKIFFMIAKSDTVRRDGIGAQESQESAIKNSIKAIIKTLIEQGVTDLEDYEIMPYNGGGHALQRGGGRLSELPSIYGRYAFKALQELEKDFESNVGALRQINKIKISAPCFTVQGHQNYVLFHPDFVGGGFLSSLASQAVYAQARLRGAIPNKEVDELPGQKLTDDQKEDLRQKAEMARHLCCEKSVEEYQLVKEPEGVINRLFANACWVATKVDNKSSRAGVRGLGDGSVASGTTFEMIKGKGNKLLDQRAIGAEKLCSHSGTHLISWFSVKAGLQAVKEAAVSGESCSLNEMYRGSKATRDSIRGIATSLFMVDFELAWPMMVGPRPDEEAIKALQEAYKSKVGAGKQAEISPAETMAFLEGEFLETAKLVYETVAGKESGPDFTAKNLLDKWTEIKEEIEHREQRCRFGHVMETLTTDLINKNPKTEVTDTTLKLVEHAYCGSDFTNTPLGILLSLTKDRSPSVSLSSLSSDSENLTNVTKNFIEMARPRGVSTPISGVPLSGERAATASLS